MCHLTPPPPPPREKGEGNEKKPFRRRKIKAGGASRGGNTCRLRENHYIRKGKGEYDFGNEITLTLPENHIIVVGNSNLMPGNI